MAGPMLAFHFDMKRAMWSAPYMDRFAATLADWGYNTILYEVEDKFQYPRHPAIAHADALSPAETTTRMAALRKRGFRVIPMVQSLGHSEFVLTKPGYEHLRESPAHTDQYDPLSDAARDLICELIDGLIDAVRPEEYFHLGGDETWALGKSDQCKPVVEEIGVGGLYLRHMLRIMEHVIARGLRPVIWADIVLSHPEIIGGLPRRAVLMDWDYLTGGDRWPSIRIWGQGIASWPNVRDGDVPASFREHLERFAVDEQTRRDGSFRGFYCTDALRAAGFDVIVAPATRCWGDTMGIPQNSMHLPNCFAAARKGRDAGLGSCVTSWCVRHSHPEANLPGAFAAPWALSRCGAFDATELARAFTERHFGAAMPEFAEAMRLAETRVPWSESREMPATGTEREKLDGWLKAIDRKPGERERLTASTEAALAGYRSAEAILSSMRGKAETNARNLDFWMEGVAYVAFCAEFSLAVLRGKIEKESGALLKRLGEGRERTHALFAETFPEASVRAELAVRYNFHEAILRGVASRRGEVDEGR